MHFRHILGILKPTLDCLIDEQGLISAQGGIYQKNNKRTGPNNCTGWKNFRDLKIAAQGLIIAQGKNNYKKYMQFHLEILFISVYDIFMHKTYIQDYNYFRGRKQRMVHATSSFIKQMKNFSFF